MTARMLLPVSTTAQLAGQLSSRGKFSFLWTHILRCFRFELSGSRWRKPFQGGLIRLTVSWTACQRNLLQFDNLFSLGLGFRTRFSLGSIQKCMCEYFTFHIHLFLVLENTPLSSAVVHAFDFYRMGFLGTGPGDIIFTVKVFVFVTTMFYTTLILVHMFAHRFGREAKPGKLIFS